MFEQIDRPSAEYRLNSLATRLERSRPAALRAFVAAAAYDWKCYQRERSAHIRHGTSAPREALVSLAQAGVAEAARLAPSLECNDAERATWRDISIDELVAELEQIAMQMVNER